MDNSIPILIDYLNNSTLNNLQIHKILITLENHPNFSQFQLPTINLVEIYQHNQLNQTQLKVLKLLTFLKCFQNDDPANHLLLLLILDEENEEIKQFSENSYDSINVLETAMKALNDDTAQILMTHFINPILFGKLYDFLKKNKEDLKKNWVADNNKETNSLSVPGILEVFNIKKTNLKLNLKNNFNYNLMNNFEKLWEIVEFVDTFDLITFHECFVMNNDNNNNLIGLFIIQVINNNDSSMIEFLQKNQELINNVSFKFLNIFNQIKFHLSNKVITQLNFFKNQKVYINTLSLCDPIKTFEIIFEFLDHHNDFFLNLNSSISLSKPKNFNNKLIQNEYFNKQELSKKLVTLKKNYLGNLIFFLNNSLIDLKNFSIDEILKNYHGKISLISLINHLIYLIIKIIIIKVYPKALNAIVILNSNDLKFDNYQQSKLNHLINEEVFFNNKFETFLRNLYDLFVFQYELLEIFQKKLNPNLLKQFLICSFAYLILQEILQKFSSRDKLNFFYLENYKFTNQIIFKTYQKFFFIKIECCEFFIKQLLPINSIYFYLILKPILLEICSKLTVESLNDKKYELINQYLQILVPLCFKNSENLIIKKYLLNNVNSSKAFDLENFKKIINENDYLKLINLFEKNNWDSQTSTMGVINNHQNY